MLARYAVGKVALFCIRHSRTIACKPVSAVFAYCFVDFLKRIGFAEVIKPRPFLRAERLYFGVFAAFVSVEIVTSIVKIEKKFPTIGR